MKHRWWHWWFEHDLIIPYRFVKTWYGSKVEYKYVFCSLCKCSIKERYKDDV